MLAFHNAQTAASDTYLTRLKALRESRVARRDRGAAPDPSLPGDGMLTDVSAAGLRAFAMAGFLLHLGYFRDRIDLERLAAGFERAVEVASQPGIAALVASTASRACSSPMRL